MDGDATTFAWDWASPSAGSGQAPVPELLRQGQTRYLVGHDTLGWHDGDTWAYPLPDALGSVRQATDAAGAVTASREWTPFGVEVGAAQPGLGHTGEWFDADVGLEYLRARWYQPGTGRFTSRDVWEGNPLQPISLHAYVYGANSPLRFTDPSGYVYLTFDDGPVIGVDDSILNTLKTFNARATFFFIGQQIDLNNDAVIEIVWRVAAEGHRLGNHSYDHRTGKLDNMMNMCCEEVLEYLRGTEGSIRHALQQVKQNHPYRYYALSANNQTYVDQVIEKGTGLFRPPGGKITSDQVDLLNCWEVSAEQIVCPTGLDNPYGVYKWDVDPRDWAISNAYSEGSLTYEQATEMLSQRLQYGWYKRGVAGKIFRNLRPSPLGSFGVQSNTDNILLHSNTFTAGALGENLSWLRAEGYTFDLLNPGWAD